MHYEGRTDCRAECTPQRRTKRLLGSLRAALDCSGLNNHSEAISLPEDAISVLKRRMEVATQQGDLHARSKMYHALYEMEV
jgi:hypothetical protein